MRISVFGGSSPKPGDLAYEQAYYLGKLIGEAGYTVLTGGYIGTMEAVSRGAAEAGGHVIGVTCDQIENWRRFFNEEQILVLRSESFYEGPAATLKRVIQFLNLKDWRFEGYEKFNVGRYREMNVDTRKRLVAFYQPYNQRLCELLGVDFGWDR